MAAIGFVLFVVGWILLKGFGMADDGSISAVDVIGVPLALIGTLLMVVSVTVWLWRNMP